MRRFYRIAGINFCVSTLEDEGFEDDGILTNFRTVPTTEHHEIILHLKEQLDAPEGALYAADGSVCAYRENDKVICYRGCYDRKWEKGYLRIARAQDRSVVQLRKHKDMIRLSAGITLEAMELQHQLVQQDGLLLHATYIHVNGEAILFTAPSGTGKSTQAVLWCSLRGAELVNGDRAAVTVEKTGVYAWGVPYSGSSLVRKNANHPLKAVVVLSQAKETTISRLEGMAAFRKIWEGCSVDTWDPEDMNRCAQTVMNLLSCVPVYHLACTPDESAVRILETVLRK